MVMPSGKRCSLCSSPIGCVRCGVGDFCSPGCGHVKMGLNTDSAKAWQRGLDDGLTLKEHQEFGNSYLAGYGMGLRKRGTAIR